MTGSGSSAVWARPGVPFRLALAATIAALACLASSAQAAVLPEAVGDGSRVYFATDEPLLPVADVDESVDVYERSSGALSLVTIGDPACAPGCGNGAHDVNGIHLVPDGVVFSTAESLAPADTDESLDIYRRSDQGLSLVSPGEDELDAVFESVGEDGSTVVFTTAEQLSSDDDDEAVDIYEHTAGGTVLVSRGQAFNGDFDATFATDTPDASVILFLTEEPILSLDKDEAIDVYERQGGVTTLISRGTLPANGDFDVDEKVLTSKDGARTVFSSAEPIMEPDEDDKTDVYMRFGGTTTLVSNGSYNPFEGEYPVALEGLDPLANQVLFSTNQVLSEEDRDVTGLDIFEWFYGKTILVSQGPFEPHLQSPIPVEFAHYSPGGYGAVFFTTTNRLLSEDTDSSVDLYERQLGEPKQTEIYFRAEGTTKLVSRGPNAFNGAFEPTFRMISPDGLRVFFTTTEKLVSADTDSSVDLYERFKGQETTLVSAGDVNGNGPFDVTPLGTGARPLFSTSEQLVQGDGDSTPDLYERSGGETRLISTAKADPPAPAIEASDPASPARVNLPSFRGAAEPGSTVELFAGPDCGGAALATGSAAEFASPGLAIPVPENATTTVSARATDANNHASACSAGFGYVEDSTPAAPPSLTAVLPRGPSRDTNPTVLGTAEPGGAVELFANGLCSGPPAARGTSEQLAGGIAVKVPENATTAFSATVTDVAGNVSACSGGSLDYTADTAPPETTIHGPGGRTRDATPTFTAQSSERDSRLKCLLDGGPSRRCGAIFTLRRLRLGRHTVSVTAIDRAGNADPTPAVRTFRVLRKKRRR